MRGGRFGELLLVACASVVCGMLASSANGEDAQWSITDPGMPYVNADFTLTEGTWMSVDVSPDGRWIAFDLLGDIYRIPAAGGEATLLHGGPAIQVLPKFSPDGSRILFISDASGSDNVWQSATDGTKARQVTQETTDALTGPAWDPRGPYIAAAKRYDSFPTIRSSEIRLFHLDGGAGRVLVSTPSNKRDVHEVEFSADGRYLFYTQRVSNPSIFADANHKNLAIYRRDLESGDVEEIALGFGSAMTPQVSPDGKRLAFVRRVREKTVLFDLDLDSRQQTPVFDGLDRDVSADFMQQNSYYPQFGWFPDNRHVAIWGKGKLYRIDMNTGASTEIPFRARSQHRIMRTARFTTDLAPDTVQVRAVRHTTVAPDGNTILFNALGRLWVQPTANGEPRRLTKSTAFESEPVFSPDGRSIAYVEWDDERGSALRVVGVNGRNPRTLAESSAPIREPSFSPNGQQIVYRVDDPSSYMGGYREKPGIYRVSARGGDAIRVAGRGVGPGFSSDGARILYSYISADDDSLFYSTATREGVLESVDIDGNATREHARGPNLLDLQLSPDGRWLSFSFQKQYYVMPYRETGQPVPVDPGSDAVPVALVTENGGYHFRWSADAQSVYWSLGDTVYRRNVNDLFADPEEPASPFVRIDLAVEADRPEGTLVLKNARIITLADAGVIEQGTIVIEDNRIAAVGPADSIDIPDNAFVVDLAGKSIMPGLVDMHGHIDCCYGQADMMPQKQASRYAALAFGVTTNFDPYSSDLPGYTINETNLSGITVGPRAINVGSVVYGRSQKPDFVYAPIRNVDDARRVMARKRALGGSVIKSYKQPMRSQRQQILKAAYDAEINVDVEGESHFYNNVSMVLDGHMAVEHNFPVANYYDDLVQLFAHSDVAHTPTLIIIFGELFGENYLYQTDRAWEDPRLRSYVQDVTASYSPLNAPYGAPPHVRGMTSIHAADEVYEIGYRAVSRSMRKLNDAGVLINAGSHGQVAGLAMHWEMRLLADGGMSNLDVLRAATINGAKTLGLDGQIGSLEPGKLADLIVLDENPLDDIRNSRSVRYTIINGRMYDSLSMNEIGIYDRPRSKFYWEMRDYNDIDWNEAWTN